MIVPPFAARQRRWLESLSTDAALLTHLPDIRYLSGFTGSSALLATAKGKLAFFTDGRYTAQAREQVAGARVVVDTHVPLRNALAWLTAHGAGKIAIESEHLTLAQAMQMRSLLKTLKGRARLQPTMGTVSALRTVKDAGELTQIRKAIALASGCFEAVLRALVPGRSEISAAAALEFACRSQGAEGMSFDTIVAAGERSALPHGVASAHPIPRRGFAILDYGVILGGYCSDMTRTVCLGKPSTRQRDAYAAVLEAQEAAKAAIRPGTTAGAIDAAARKVLARARLARYFTHSTGHGVGLEIHEPPRLGKKQNEVLQPGMVITVEPGVYLPREFGVRIEDMVLVTPNGHETLTPTSRELITL